MIRLYWPQRHPRESWKNSHFGTCRRWNLCKFFSLLKLSLLVLLCQKITSYYLQVANTMQLISNNVGPFILFNRVLSTCCIAQLWGGFDTLDLCLMKLIYCYSLIGCLTAMIVKCWMIFSWWVKFLHMLLFLHRNDGQHQSTGDSIMCQYFAVWDQFVT